MNSEWVDVAPLERVPDGDVIGIIAAGREIALYLVDGEVFATDNICTHGQARMSDGFLDGCEIECPLHQGKFNICSGKALCAPLTEDLRTYPVKVESGRVLLNLG
ncbi:MULTISPECIES: non-heme iron oxygenase ferredoxin subunit [unclassified Pseudomonas]|uniref:non-heme iron oxygenase ferredoxin subunit n=1 Tax=unclassified Pseudomonas TaxID=196821 RepID=UPI000771F8F6|nr:MULTISPECIES: non-heme iron oxygenase ferredoxin subunit [unclassified Pseudomonas]AMK37598.1 naphthalene 12-dioxygenase/salicylate 5-hydroxylase ferredoxin component [Pseudomonas sp. C5pp]